MDLLDLDTRRAAAALPEALCRRAEACNRALHNGTGQGSDFLGWLTLPSSTDATLFDAIRSTARRLRSAAQVVVCIGIGGSYLGAKAVLEALGDPYAPLRRPTDDPLLLFAGQNLSEDYLAELLAVVRTHDTALIVISKSGTTTEPAVAFRLLRAELERRYGVQEAARRIVAVTDPSQGALRRLAGEQGYETFAIPPDVGGRYSVLTPVGLVPLAVAGIDIGALMDGARRMEQATGPDVPAAHNPAIRYAVVRHMLYEKGKRIEILGSYEPRLQYVAEWWKQLFGESEGKQGLGLFPASITLTADLHSMGQYIQQGERLLFETIISVREPRHRLEIPSEERDDDQLNYLAGRRISDVNRMAELGVALAHVEGEVPNLRIDVPRIDAQVIGALLYFFEKACGISGYLLGVNPFDQPGVEAYKRNMFALLDRPGYEELGRTLREAIDR